MPGSELVRHLKNAENKSTNEVDLEMESECKGLLSLSRRERQKINKSKTVSGSGK